jgi:hypothetical protein
MRMKKIIIALSVLLLSPNVVHSESQTTQENETDNRLKPICLLSGEPPSDVKFTTIRKIKVGKHGYGSVNDLIPLLVAKARKLEADAIVRYNGAQRFGVLPWQFVRPTVTGTAVNWEHPEDIDCKGMGGTYKTRLNGPLTTDA